MSFVYREILFPLIRRAGTAVGIFLVAKGVDENTATQIATGVVAVAGVVFDLIGSHLERKGKTIW